MRRLIPFLLLLAVAGCGGGDEGESGGSGGAAASAIPPGFPVVVEVDADLEGDQWGSVLAYAERLDPSDQDLLAAFKESLFSDGVSYEDAQSWLGDDFVLGLDGITDEPLGVFALSTTDEDAAKAFLEETLDTTDTGTYEGVEYFIEDGQAYSGVVDGLMVSATDEAKFKAAVDAVRGTSIADDAAYQEALERAPDDTFATAFFEVDGFVDLLEQSGAVPPETIASIEAAPQLASGQTLVASVAAEDDKMTFEIAGEDDGSGSGEAPELAELPGEAWLAVAAALPGEAFAEGFRSGFEASGGAGSGAILDQSGLIEYLNGITSVAARFGGTGITALNGELTFGGGNADATLVRRIADTINGFGGPPIQVQGATATLAVPPFTFELAAEDGDLRLRLGDAPAGTLGDEEAFTTALDELGLEEAQMFIDFAPLEQLVRTLPDADTDEALPVLAELGYLILGTEVEDEVFRARAALTLRG